MSDHYPEELDELPPWMCTEVEARMGFCRRQFLLLLLIAALSGFAFTAGIVGVLGGVCGLLVAGGLACGEVTDALTDAAWAQHEHEWENSRP